MRYLLVVLALVLLLFGSACSDEEEPLVPLSPDPVVPSQGPIVPAPSDPVTPSQGPIVPTPSGPSATPSQVPAASIEDAIQEYLAKDGIEYAGDCATTDIDTDIGKYCSTVAPNSGDTATANIGPTFSEYISTLTLTRTDEGWVVTDAVPIEYPDVFQDGGH